MHSPCFSPDLVGAVGSWLGSCCLLTEEALGILPAVVQSFPAAKCTVSSSLAQTWSRTSHILIQNRSVLSSLLMMMIFLCAVGKSTFPLLFASTPGCVRVVKEWIVWGSWSIPLTGSEGGVSSGCAWANTHRQGTWTALCLVSLWTEWKGDIPSCRQTRVAQGFVAAGLKPEFGYSCSQC